MKDPEEALRTGYLKAFDGKIGLFGKAIPVYVAAVPSYEEAPYICLAEVTITADPLSRDCTTYDCTMLVDIITEYDNNRIKPSDASRIGAAVMKLSENIEITLDGNWQVLSHRLELSQSLLEENEPKIVNRRLVRFRNKLYYTGLNEGANSSLDAILLETNETLIQQ